MDIIITILKFLQKNAEWMSAIAIVIFTAVQCMLAYQQNMQNIRIKRLELASRLDEVTAQFLGKKEEAELVRAWLASNASNFGALLNSKDIVPYKKLARFILEYLNTDISLLNQEQQVFVLSKFSNMVSELDAVLINAKYGFVKAGKEFEPVKTAE